MLRYFHRLESFILFTTLTILFVGCASSTTSNGTGSATAKLVWNNSNSTPLTKSTAKAADGVTTVKIIVTATGMTDIQKDFAASDSGGTITGIPAGNGRTFTAQGLDVNGLVIYQGATGDITIQAGQTTDVGTIIMLQSATVSSGSFSNAKFGTAKFGN